MQAIQWMILILTFFLSTTACFYTQEEKPNEAPVSSAEEENNPQDPSDLEEPLMIQAGESRLTYDHFVYQSGNSSGNNYNADHEEDDRSFWTFCHLVTPPIVDSIAIIEKIPQNQDSLLLHQTCENHQRRGWYNYKIRVWAVVAGEGLPYDFEVFGVSDALNQLNDGEFALATFVKYKEDWYDFDVLKITNTESEELNQNVPLPIDFESLSRGAEDHRQHLYEYCTKPIDLNRIRNFPDDESFRKMLYWDDGRDVPSECEQDQAPDARSLGE